MASKIIGRQQGQIHDIYVKRVWNKAKAILDHPDHPLYKEFQVLPSGRRFRMSKTKTRRARNSFIPVAIERLNLLGSV